MQLLFSVVLIATALLASTSPAMSATIIGFGKVDCTGAAIQRFSVPSGECFSFGGASFESISYSDVPNDIQFFVSDGGCTNGPTLVNGGGSGCVTAPFGVGWKSVVVS